MVNLFFETVNDKLKTITQAIILHDAEKIRDAAHYIKGGASNLGAQKISHVVEKMEILEEEEISVHVEKLLQELKLELKNFREFANQI